MKFERLIEAVGALPCFDYASVCLLAATTGESGDSIATSLHRFRKSGRIIELRRGIYAFSETYRKSPLHAPYLAGVLYHPSYLSELWALSWHGIIPEATVMLTSVSVRVTRSFENAFGRFRYRSIQAPLFSGFRTETIMGLPVRIAEAEKALLDLWYLESGEWTEERMESMRFEPGVLDPHAVAAMATRTGIPRLARAGQAWLSYTASQGEGDRSL